MQIHFLGVFLVLNNQNEKIFYFFYCHDTTCRTALLNFTPTNEIGYSLCKKVKY